MESRSSFPTVATEFLRGTMDPATTTGTGLGGETLKGMERNTARGVKEAVVLKDIIKLEHAPATDAPPVEGFKTYGEL
jgi:hypothetical protein